MNADQQGDLLDRITSGRCPFPDCNGGGQHLRTLTWVVNSLSLGVALTCGVSRLFTADVRVCSIHAR